MLEHNQFKEYLGGEIDELQEIRKQLKSLYLATFEATKNGLPQSETGERSMES